MKYLCGQAQHMKARALVHLAQLADHLGLSSLLDAAAESVVVLPWHHNMEWLVALLKIPVYQKNTEQRNKLLHHPQRGACTELQVLAVLEHVGIPRADFASAVDLQGLQPAELRALLVILVDCEEDGPFLRAAVKQDLVPEALRAAPDRTQNVRILHNVVIPDAQSTLTLPDSMLTLDVRVCKDKEGEADVHVLCLFVSPSILLFVQPSLFSNSSDKYVLDAKQLFAPVCRSRPSWYLFASLC